MLEAAADKEFDDRWNLPSLEGVTTNEDVFGVFEILREYIHKAAEPEYVLCRWEFLVDREKDAGRLPFSQRTNRARIPEGERKDLVAELTSAVWNRIRPVLTELENMTKSEGASPLILSRLVWLEEKILPLPRVFRGEEMSSWQFVPVFANTEFRLRRSLHRIASEPERHRTTSAPHLEWRGEPADLLELIEALVGKNWLKLPVSGGRASRTELARIVHGLFKFSDGEGIELGTMIQYMKKSGLNPEGSMALRMPWNPKFAQKEPE